LLIDGSIGDHGRSPHADANALPTISIAARATNSRRLDVVSQRLAKSQRRAHASGFMHASSLTPRALDRFAGHSAVTITNKTVDVSNMSRTNNIDVTRKSAHAKTLLPLPKRSEIRFSERS
jgi:hypothetical protein